MLVGFLETVFRLLSWCFHPSLFAGQDGKLLKSRLLINSRYTSLIFHLLALYNDVEYRPRISLI